jgi:hypothetical protein
MHYVHINTFNFNETITTLAHHDSTVKAVGLFQ